MHSWWLVSQLLKKVYLEALPALKSCLPHVSGAECVYASIQVLTWPCFINEILINDKSESRP